MEKFVAPIEVGETLDGPFVPKDLSDVLDQGDRQLNHGKALWKIKINLAFKQDYIMRSIRRSTVLTSMPLLPTLAFFPFEPPFCFGGIVS